MQNVFEYLRYFEYLLFNIQPEKSYQYFAPL